LKPGNYTVGIEVPGGWTCTTTNPTSVSLGSWPCKNAKVDFGCHFPQNEETGSISGHKFNDENGNGRRDRGEPGIAGITIWAGDKSTVTDENGDFSFEGLKPGAYTVREECPQGWTCTTGSEKQVTPKSGCEDKKVEFGNHKEEPGSISGYKFNDLNGNGVRDPGEPGIPNVLINLWYFWEHQEVMTDSTGHYSFKDLDPAWYKVEVDESTAPPGMKPTTQIWAFVWVDAGKDSPADFGNMTEKPLNALHCSIHGTKFMDTNANGEIDGNDATLPGLTITLTGDTLDKPISTKTDSLGNYSFTDLEAGTYTVTEDTSDSTMKVILDPSLSKSLAPGEDWPHADFLNSKSVEVSPEGPITPESPTSSVGPTELGSPTPTVLGSTTSNESLPGTGINELPLLFIAGFLVLAGILLLAFGIFKRRRLDSV